MTPERRFATSILFEIATSWNQELGSFVATARCKRNPALSFDIGDAKDPYPTIAEFRAALTSWGVTLPATTLSQLDADRETAQAAAARAKARTKTE